MQLSSKIIARNSEQYTRADLRRIRKFHYFAGLSQLGWIGLDWSANWVSPWAIPNTEMLIELNVCCCCVLFNRMALLSLSAEVRKCVGYIESAGARVLVIVK